MKLTIVLATTLGYLALTFGHNVPSLNAAFDARVPAKEYVLSKDSKDPDAPKVPFSHDTHANKNYSIDGTKKIACIECHHTDQPAEEAAKKPPLKSADPMDRKTTLVEDLLAKDASAPDVKTCRACHDQTGKKPRAWPENPKVTYEGETEAVVLNNEEAYHRNCNTCHDALPKDKVKAPRSDQCATCHTGKDTPAL